MPEHLSHGRRYVEPPRHDELTEGITAARSGLQKRTGGRFTAGPSGSAVEAGAEGGRRHKGRTRLSHHIPASKLAPESLRRARTLRRALAGELAAGVGGGVCGIAASLFLKFAAQKTAAAEEAFAVGDYEAHRRLSESARMDILYAREHAAKEAKARPEPTGPMTYPWSNREVEVDDDDEPEIETPAAVADAPAAAPVATGAGAGAQEPSAP
jgi:hypothetical protein